jgi:hypothetical protein
MDDVVGPIYTSFFPFHALLTTVIMKNFGRHRQSIVDIEQELHDIFRGHPQCSDNSEGVASLPARCLPDVFDTYQEEYGLELLTKDEMASFMQIVDASPDLEVTPDIILQLVAMRTSSSQQIDAEDHSSNAGWDRGRVDERDHQSPHSRSSSNGGSRPPSRPSSRVGGAPRTPGAKDSPFDAQKRQRSTPLAPVAPSSWTRRPAAPSRRKSDASNYGRPMSDSEVSFIPAVISLYIFVASCGACSMVLMRYASPRGVFRGYVVFCLANQTSECEDQHACLS